jgi:hypothetical protein
MPEKENKKNDRPSTGKKAAGAKKEEPLVLI